MTLRLPKNLKKLFGKKYEGRLKSGTTVTLSNKESLKNFKVRSGYLCIWKG